jgi:hypothetical protein
VLYDPSTNFLCQPKVAGEFRRVGNVRAVPHLIGTLPDVDFLFGFGQFRHTTSVRKVWALRGTQRPCVLPVVVYSRIGHTSKVLAAPPFYGGHLEHLPTSVWISGG